MPGGVTGLYQPCTSANLAQANLTTAPPLYGLWIYNPAQATQQPIVAPTEGIMYDQFVAMQPRTLPTPILYDAVAGVNYDQSLATATVGIIDIKSVYDFDGTTQMAPGGGPVSIVALRDPLQTPATNRPARFLRLEKAVGLPDKTVLKDLPDSAFGAASYMRDILGYVPIEPDGSVEVEVPADVAFMISVLDANGQRIGTVHGNWLQVRAGEVKTCNGCHTQGQAAPGAENKSHGRAALYAPLNPGAPTTGQPFPNTNPAVLGPAGAKAGETMAEARARVNCSSIALPGTLTDCPYLRPSVDLIFTSDVWAPTSLPPAPVIQLQYSTLITPSPLDNTQWSNCELGGWNSQCRILINYPAVIQPLWSISRIVTVNNVTTNNTCISCHSPANAQKQPQVPAASLDLSATNSSVQQDWFTSFQELLFPRQQLTLSMGVVTPLTVPVQNPVTGVITQVPAPPLPAPMVGGSALASTGFFSIFANPLDAVHYQILSPSELRLVSEWLDIGAQYYNSPFDIPN